MQNSYCVSQGLIPKEEIFIKKQVQAAWEKQDVQECDCGILEVTIFPNRPAQSFGALICCKCTHLRSPMVRGLLS
jgi:hypothetical protein